MQTSPDCAVANIRLASQDVNTLVHELTHALIDLNYPAQCNMTDTLWLHEATATWAEHFLYPANNREHGAAFSFLGRPELELEKYEQTPDDKPGPEHQYGAYLWFLYITGGFDSGAHYVKATWDATRTHDSLSAINAVIPDGLKERWPEFALYNWNRKHLIRIGEPGAGKPYRYYFNWDKLNLGAKEMTRAPVEASLHGKTSHTYPLTHIIKHLAARYFHYDFTADPAIHSLTFTHPYSEGDEPTARVQAIVKIRGQEWQPAEDWTRLSQKTFCFDKPAEDVEELVIVISNSEFVDRSHLLANIAELTVSARSCNPWVGTIEYSHTHDQVPDANNQFFGIKISETASTAVTFELLVLPGAEIPNENLHQATVGISTWHHTGTLTDVDGQCSGTGFGIVDVAVTPGGDADSLILLQLPPPLGDGSTLHYEGFGRIDPVTAGMFITYPCVSYIPLPPPGRLPWDVSFGFGDFKWFKTQRFLEPGMHAATVDAEGNLVMRGSFSEEEGDLSLGLHVRKWSWELKQQRRPQ